VCAACRERAQDAEHLDDLADAPDRKQQTFIK
jgi:hypothetical protein